MATSYRRLYTKHTAQTAGQFDKAPSAQFGLRAEEEAHNRYGCLCEYPAFGQVKDPNRTILTPGRWKGYGRRVTNAEFKHQLTTGFRYVTRNVEVIDKDEKTGQETKSIRQQQEKALYSLYCYCQTEPLSANGSAQPSSAPPAPVTPPAEPLSTDEVTAELEAEQAIETVLEAPDAQKDAREAEALERVIKAMSPEQLAELARKMLLQGL